MYVYSHIYICSTNCCTEQLLTSTAHELPELDAQYPLLLLQTLHALCLHSPGVCVRERLSLCLAVCLSVCVHVCACVRVCVYVCVREASARARDRVCLLSVLARVCLSVSQKTFLSFLSMCVCVCVCVCLCVLQNMVCPLPALAWCVCVCVCISLSICLHVCMCSVCVYVGCIFLFFGEAHCMYLPICIRCVLLCLRVHIACSHLVWVCVCLAVCLSVFRFVCLCAFACACLFSSALLCSKRERTILNMTYKLHSFFGPFFLNTQDAHLLKTIYIYTRIDYYICARMYICTHTCVCVCVSVCVCECGNVKSCVNAGNLSVFACHELTDIL